MGNTIRRTDFPIGHYKRTFRILIFLLGIILPDI